MMITCWLWLQIVYNRQEFVQCRWKKSPSMIQREKHLKETLQKQYDELGSFRYRRRISVK